ncbi:hypothetical protein DFH07DRAFT_843577 [Mycena maculata]|uniref:Uncharacterized protein n=1 Tax=Mycena maculata TaxID=230809 RepID=A0AAD7I5R2_9AGAR|nr:hypothetical protein DFH07DRAFT_843577 [Mycena maculata]
MDEDLIADPGYESDTGPRDNPTCANFLKQEPIQRTFEVGAGKKVLNRTGRAICRIVYAHSWSAAEISRIFDISSTSVSRAVENIRYIPRDRVSEDYERVDPEFAVYFPPVTIPNVTTIKTSDSPGAADALLDDVSMHNDQIDIYKCCTILESDDAADDSPDERPLRKARVGFSSRMRAAFDSDDDDEPLEAFHKRSREDEPLQKRTSTSGEIQGQAPSATKKPRYGDVSSNVPSPGQTANTASAAFIFRSWKEPPGQASSSPSSAASKPSSSARTSTPAIPSPAPPAPQIQKPAALPHRALLLPPPPNAQSSTGTLALFLKNVMTIDLTAHHDLMEAQGFSVPRLGVVATWGREAIQETLSRLLMGSEPAAGGWKGMTAVESITLELAIRKFKGSSLPPARSALPPPSSNPNNSGTTLPAFLKNVMGLDLRAHHDLLQAQGFDVARLSGIATWGQKDIQEMFNRSLRGDGPGVSRRGMKALEVLALEFAVRNVGKAG